MAPQDSSSGVDPSSDLGGGCHGFEAIRRAHLTSYRAAREDPLFVSRSIEQIIECLGELATATHWGRVRTTMDRMLKKPNEQYNMEPEELVCYCLGDLSELNVAFQLAFFLQIAHHFAIPPARRFVFDPLHTEKDKEILKICRCTVLSHNEHALRRVHCHTLFYMPFAPFYLTDNLLRANWDVLDKVAVIGNPLNWVVDHRWKEKFSIGGNMGDTGRNDEPGSRSVSPVSGERAEEQKHQHQFGQQHHRSHDRYTSRAPCVEAALELVTEVTLWQEDLVTWTLAQAAHELKRERSEMNVRKEDHDKDSRFSNGHVLPTGAAQRAKARSALNASLAVFAAPPIDWPKQPPPLRTWAVRSRL